MRKHPLIICKFDRRWNSHDPCRVLYFTDIKGRKRSKLLSSKTSGNHAVQFYSGLCGHLNASCFFCVFECLVCWVTSVGFQQACHSDCLSWGRDLCESCFSSSLLGPECWWRPASQVAHTSKQEGPRLLVFRQTSLTFFVVWGTGGMAVYLLRISPRYHLPPAHRHIPQEPLKANVSQGKGVAFLRKVN